MYRFFAVIFFLLFKNAMLLGAPPEKPNFIIILTDDQGWADFSANSPNSNLQTPNLDKLVRAGANFTNAYTSAPQCVPTRAGLLLGKVQNKLEIEKNGDSLERFAEKQNIAELLSDKGYTSALIGKWHLGPPKEIPDHGFRFFYNHISTAPFWANFSDQGALTDNQKINSSKYHIEGCSETAVTFIREFAQAPFLLFLSLRAPHVPLDAPHKYSDRFPKKLPEARRQALGMFAAIDDGIGLIQEELRRLSN